MIEFEYFYLNLIFVQTYDLDKFILAKLYEFSYFFQLKIFIKYMLYTSFNPITKEIKLFKKMDISITLTLFNDIFLITYKHHFIELKVTNILM